MYFRAAFALIASLAALPASATVYSFSDLYLENPKGSDHGYTEMSGFIETTFSFGKTYIVDYEFQVSFHFANPTLTIPDTWITETVGLIGDDTNSIYANYTGISGSESHFTDLVAPLSGYEIYVTLDFDDIVEGSTSVLIEAASVYAPFSRTDVSGWIAASKNRNLEHTYSAQSTASPVYLSAQISAVPAPLSALSLAGALATLTTMRRMRSAAS
ncbi:MAG: hypothetical protein ACPGNV_00965 [Mangrovicoccus sp.]